MTCVMCFSNDTELFRGDDGHFRKRCNACEHVGGPYVSQQSTDSSGEQSSLDSWM